MKKIFYVTLCAIALVGMTSCKSKMKTSPGEKAKAYHENIKVGNYDAYVECIAIEPGTPAEVTKQQKQEHANVLKTYHKPVVAQKGGIKDVAIKSETVAPDGKSADVVLTTTYNNGETEDIHYSMILDKNSEWKVKLGNDKEVWRAIFSDGTRKAFKLKEDAHRDMVKWNEDGEDRSFVKDIEDDNRDVSKVKTDGEKDVAKTIDKENKTVVKEKVGGEKTTTVTPK